MLDNSNNPSAKWHIPEYGVVGCKNFALTTFLHPHDRDHIFHHMEVGESFMCRFESGAGKTETKITRVS